MAIPTPIPAFLPALSCGAMAGSSCPVETFDVSSGRSADVFVEADVEVAGINSTPIRFAKDVAYVCGKSERSDFCHRISRGSTSAVALDKLVHVVV